MTTQETFGVRVRRLREAKGYFERVNEDCDPDKFPAIALCRLAASLGVSMDYLYSGAESDSWANTPGKRIRMRRDELGWSAVKMTDESKVSWITLAHLEMDPDGYVGASAGAVHSVAKALGVTPSWILTGAEPKFPPKPKAPDADWFRGWSGGNDSPCITMKAMGDLDCISCAFYVDRGMAANMIELIRTGKMPEDK
jgi:hypothetical protein